MTPEEKARAKEQAKRWMSQIPVDPKPRKPRKPRQATGPRTLPPCIYPLAHKSGVFYRAQFKRAGKIQYVGTYPTVELAQLWLDRAKRNPKMPKGVVLL